MAPKLLFVFISMTSFTVTSAEAGATLASLVREHLSGQSWRQVRGHIARRRVRLNGELCLDPARRLKEADAVEVLAESVPPPRQEEAVVIRFVDAHVVVVEKPAGLSTVRHPAERSWPESRRVLTPTLDDCVRRLLAERAAHALSSGKRSRLPRLRIVHRLDKETSGLVVFARTVAAERGLGRQFHDHTVLRRYLAIVPGEVTAQRIASHLVRDRGDGRRGSTTLSGAGKEAVTHVEVVERLAGHTLVSCRLETGRTHQIRIHLAESGHPVCGERVYGRSQSGQPQGASDAPRLALHAVELGFRHPATGEPMHWTMPPPADLEAFLNRLRADSVTARPRG